MAKIINTFFFISVLAIIGCSQSQIDLAKINIEKQVKENMNNPKSYEFVKMDSLTNITKIDSLLNKQTEIMKGADRIMLVKTSLKNLVVSELYLMADGGKVDLKKHNENKQQLDSMGQSIDEYLKQVDSISKVLDDSLQYAELQRKVIGYKTNFSYRGTNEQGAIVLMKQKVELDKNLKVTSIK